MPYHFDFTLTYAELYAFNKFYQKNTPKVMLRRRIYLFGVPALVFCVVFFLLWIGRVTHSWIGAMIFAAIVAAIYFAILRWRWNSRGKKTIQKRVRDQKEASWDFGKDDFTATRQDITANFKYTLIQRVYDEPAGIYLFTTENTSLVIPSRVFQSAEERADFLAFIKSKIATGESK